MLGLFTTDPLEKEFSKLRQGSGGPYFITAQQVLEKVNISKTRLLLKLRNTSADDLSQMETGHCCAKCDFVLDERMCEIMDCLPEMQPSISVDSMMGLVYIAGYIVGKGEIGNDADDSHFYYNKYGSFTDNLNRGGLHLPGDTVCQWVVYDYIMFSEVVNLCCRKSLCRILSNLSDLYDLLIKDIYLPILANILFNNYCSLCSPKATQEPRQIILKLCNN